MAENNNSSSKPATRTSGDGKTGLAHFPDPTPEESLDGGALKDTEELRINRTPSQGSGWSTPKSWLDGDGGFEVQLHDTEKPQTFEETLEQSRRESRAERAKKADQKVGKIGAIPFASLDEQQAAQADPRYSTDRAYREAVIARIRVTP